MSQQQKKTQAISLLEGILEETQSEAAAERERLERDLRKKEEAEREAKAVEDKRRREEAERRLADEEERRRQSAERRAAELERLRIEELKAKGLWKEPEPDPVEQVAVPVTSARPQMSTQEALAVTSQANKQARKLPMILAAAAIFIIVIGGGAFYMISQIEFVDESTPYAKADATTLQTHHALATIGFDPVPEPVIPEAPAVEDTAAAPAAPGRRTGTQQRATTTQAEPETPRVTIGTGSLLRDRD